MFRQSNCRFSNVRLRDQYHLLVRRFVFGTFDYVIETFCLLTEVYRVLRRVDICILSIVTVIGIIFEDRTTGWRNWSSTMLNVLLKV